MPSQIHLITLEMPLKTRTIFFVIALSKLIDCAKIREIGESSNHAEHKSEREQSCENG